MHRLDLGLCGRVVLHRLSGGALGGREVRLRVLQRLPGGVFGVLGVGQRGVRRVGGALRAVIPGLSGLSGRLRVGKRPVEACGRGLQGRQLRGG